MSTVFLSLVFFVMEEDLHSLAVEVLESIIHATVWNAAVVGEAHGFLVGVLLAMHATVAMVAICYTVVDGVTPTGDVHIKVKVHSLFGSLGQEEPVWVSTATSVVASSTEV